MSIVMVSCDTQTFPKRYELCVVGCDVCVLQVKYEMKSANEQQRFFELA